MSANIELEVSVPRVNIDWLSKEIAPGAVAEIIRRPNAFSGLTNEGKGVVFGLSVDAAFEIEETVPGARIISKSAKI